MTQLDSYECLDLVSLAIAEDTYPLPPPFSSVPQRVVLNLEAHSATVLWGGVVAAEVQVYLLEDSGGVEEGVEGAGAEGGSIAGAAEASVMGSLAGGAGALQLQLQPHPHPPAAVTSKSRSVANVASPLLRGMPAPQQAGVAARGAALKPSSSSLSSSSSSSGSGKSESGRSGSTHSSSEGKPHLLVEFKKGPAADVFAFKRLWTSTRKFLETELRKRQAQE